MFDRLVQLSVGMLVACWVLGVLSFFVRANEHHVSLAKHLHVGLLSYRMDGFDFLTSKEHLIPDPRLSFFSDNEYGPYEGSITGFSPDETTHYYFGDEWGIYYRYWSWSKGDAFWTLSVSLWYPIGLFSIPPFIRLFFERTIRISLKVAIQIVTLVCLALGAASLGEIYHPFPYAAILCLGILCATLRYTIPKIWRWYFHIQP